MTPVGPAGYGVAAGGGWRTLWCRRGRTVGGSGFLGWVQCRSGRRISDGWVWRKITMSLQEEECHAERSSARRDSRYIHVHAYVHLRMYLHADRTVRPKKLASFEPGSSFNL
eukprot:scaffold4680_cov164-Skeletonema_marinoi.AAC.6